MINMKAYFEGAVSAKNSGRVVDILKSRVSRQVGQQIYATTAMDVVIKDGKKVYGIFLMFEDGHHAIRLNWISTDTSASIDSIDFWIHVSKNPQYSADTKDMNIVQIVELIDDVVKGVNLKEEDTIQESIKPVLEAAGKTFKDVKNLLENKGYIIEKDPAFTVRRYLVTDKKTKEVTPIRYIPVMDEMYGEIMQIGVPAFLNKYNAAGGGAKTSGGRLKAASPETPVEVKSSPFDSLFEDPLNEKELFKLLETGVEEVKAGLSKTMIVSGDPGVGKSFTILQGMVGTNFEVFKGTITSAAALYKTLFLNNESKKTLIFDDLDTLLEDRECVNILKGALESVQNPEVSYLSNNCVHPTYYKVLTGEYDANDPKVRQSLKLLKIDLDAMSEKRLEAMQMRASDPYSAAAILPNKFVFLSRIIFITNKYLDELPSAIKSRGGTKVEVNLTLAEIVKRIGSVLDKLDIPVEPGTPPISMAARKAALKYCNDVLIPYGKIKKLDFRGFFEICKKASGDAPQEVWYRWVSRMLQESYGDKMTVGKREKR